MTVLVNKKGSPARWSDDTARTLVYRLWPPSETTRDCCWDDRHTSRGAGTYSLHFDTFPALNIDD